MMKQLREIRRQRGLTQKELGKMAGVDQSMISKIERGAQNPSIKTLARLATALGVSLDELVDEQMWHKAA